MITYMQKQLNYIVILIAFCFLPAGSVMAQGQYAGSMKKLIGTSYTDSRNIPGLKTWEFNQGSLLSDIDSAEVILVDVYRKGNTYISFISISPGFTSDTQSHRQYIIVDVVEIKKVATGYEIKTALCRQNKKEDACIIALMKPALTNYSKALKAWRFDKNKRKFLVMNAKLVDCSNEGNEQF